MGSCLASRHLCELFYGQQMNALNTRLSCLILIGSESNKPEQTQKVTPQLLTANHVL